MTVTAAIERLALEAQAESPAWGQLLRDLDRRRTLRRIRDLALSDLRRHQSQARDDIDVLGVGAGKDLAGSLVAGMSMLDFVARRQLLDVGRHPHRLGGTQ